MNQSTYQLLNGKHSKLGYCKPSVWEKNVRLPGDNEAITDEVLRIVTSGESAYIQDIASRVVKNTGLVVSRSGIASRLRRLVREGKLVQYGMTFHRKQSS